MRQIANKFLRRFSAAFIRCSQDSRVLFYRIASLGTNVTGKPIRNQPLFCRGQGEIRFGRNVRIGYFPSPYFFGCHCYFEVRTRKAIIDIGDDVTINNGFVAIAEASEIHIGSRVVIGPQVTILDSDFHGLTVRDRNNFDATKRGSVIIEDDVFIGTQVLIMKRVRVGRGSVIGAGSVVTKDVPAEVIVSGNPASVIGLL